jgi:hypothetical protein
MPNKNERRVMQRCGRYEYRPVLMASTKRLREALPPDKRGRHAGDEGSGADAGGGPGARHAGHRAR